MGGGLALVLDLVAVRYSGDVGFESENTGKGTGKGVREQGRDMGKEGSRGGAWKWTKKGREERIGSMANRSVMGRTIAEEGRTFTRSNQNTWGGMPAGQGRVRCACADPKSALA